jgi:hypothetical protein
MNAHGESHITPAAPASFRGWVWLRWLGLGGAALAIGVGLFYGFENWRGARAWAAERAIVAGAGTPVTLAALVPPEVPDASNLATAGPFPLLFAFERDPATGLVSNTNLSRALAWCAVDGVLGDGNPPGSGPSWTGVYEGATRGATEAGARSLDLTAWAAYFRKPARLGRQNVTEARLRYGLPLTNASPGEPMPSGFPVAGEPDGSARDVLAALSLFDADMEVLAAAARRPHARFPVRYEDGINALLPHLAALKRFAGVFSLRAVARLQVGDADGALEDFRTALRLSQSVEDEPLLISQLVRCATLGAALQVVWEGVTAHRWSPGQLQELQKLLAGVELIGGMRRALAGERVVGAQALVEMLVGSREGRRALEGFFDSVSENWGGSSGWYFGSLYAGWAPRGWHYLGLTEISKALRTLEASGPAEWAVQARTWPPPLPSDSVRYLLHRVYLKGGPNDSLPAVVLKAARGQAWVRLAETACRLEGYRLENGAYPERLDLLVPRWAASVPSDPMNDQPLRYETDGADRARFRLWSVGANLTDDGGRLARRPEVLHGNLDWAWTWPSAGQGAGGPEVP